MRTGAGKTTTFGMLTGDLSITSGTAIIDGFDVSTNLKNVTFLRCCLCNCMTLKIVYYRYNKGLVIALR